MIFFKLCNGLTTTWLYCPFSWVGLGALPTHKGILRFAKGLPIQVGSLPSPSWESSVHRSVTGSSSQLAYKKPALNDSAFHPAFLLDSPPCRLRCGVGGTVAAGVRLCRSRCIPGREKDCFSLPPFLLLPPYYSLPAS